VRKALIEQADELRMFRDVATLRTADVARPPDGALDRERGAEAASALGMGRLARRLAEG
jgi:DNA polymerase-1